MKAQTQCSWKNVCQPLAYSTVMRWRQRQAKAQLLWQKPGPKKDAPADWAPLFQDLHRLRPGRCRTRGAGQLYQRYAHWLSRRELAHLLKVHRQNQRDCMKHIQWLKTGLAWSIDATEYGPDDTLIVPVQDLASRYRLPALTAVRLNGPAIAAHLQRLFKEFGAPLFLKRDNGSPFNHQLVDEMLARYGVLPLNNPPHFPRYNGAMERGISEMKRSLNALCLNHTHDLKALKCHFNTSKKWSPDPSGLGKMPLKPNGEAEFLEALALSQFSLRLTQEHYFSLALENTLHHLNHKNRRSLAGQTACACFHDPRRQLRLTKRHRRQIFQLLCQRFWQRLKTMTPRNQHNYAALWRRTVEHWLRCQGLIAIRLNKKVSTILPGFLSHN
jgi:transposase InsO family protein